MPLIVDDFINPSSEWVPYILDDKYLKGGFRVFPTLADRDAYTLFAKDLAFFEDYDSRKVGMVCSVAETDTLYKLGADRETWSELELGGGIDFTPENPLQLIGNLLRIDPRYIVPPPSKAGQVLTTSISLTPLWQDLALKQGTRSTVQYTVTNAVAPGGTHDFSLDMSPSVILLHVEVNTPDMKLEGFSTSARTDNNPYTFISDEIHLIDEGIKYQNGDETKFRRFSILANLEEPVSSLQHFRITNLSPIDINPTVDIMYLSLQ